MSDYVVKDKFSDVIKDKELLSKYADFEKIVVKPHNIATSAVTYREFSCCFIKDNGPDNHEFVVFHEQIKQRKTVFYDDPIVINPNELPYPNLITDSNKYDYIVKGARPYACIQIVDLAVKIRVHDEIYVHTYFNGECKHVAKVDLEDLRFLLFDV
jgi:hypothetical protein